jgi:phosphoribosyl-AMP cyclohydrolase
MDFSKFDGLIPAVVQDNTSSEVLMVGFMNEQAWQTTQASGYVTFFSRTRNTLWTKGETSGNRLAVRQIFVDCDEDTVLIKADREGDGNVCHTGARSCFAPIGQVGQVGRVGQVGQGRQAGQLGKAKR